MVITAAPSIGSLRLHWIEWVRGFAVGLVVLAHFLAGTVPAFHDFSRSTIDIGRVGVVAFFLVSGFVVPLSYRRQSTSVFIVRRATRLYPVYLIVLGITVAFFYPHQDWTSVSWWVDLIINGTMLQQLLGGTIIAVAWTLTIEMVYYFQQIFFKTLGRLDQSWMLGYLWAAIFVAGIIAEYVLGRELPISFPMLLAVSCVGHALSLAYGGLLKIRHAVSLTLVVVGAISIAGLLRANYDALWPAHLYVVSFLGGFVVFGAAYVLRNRCQLRWAAWLGGISYALYLSHSVTGEFIAHSPRGLEWLSFAIATVTALISAWLLHRYVELPFISLGRTFGSKEKVSSQKVSARMPTEEHP